MLLFGRSVVSDSATPSTAAHQASLSFTISRSLLKLMSIDLLMPFNSTVSSSVAPFSSCLQSFSASGSFPVNQLFTSGGQSIGASASEFVWLNEIPEWQGPFITDSLHYSKDVVIAGNEP